jgi:hypothetical protein
LVASRIVIEKFRIVEWTSEFQDGSRQVTYEVQAQDPKNPKNWQSLGLSDSLADARKAILFHTPNVACYPS